ncbi:hypothetical protein Q3G72_033862 [Acer saccharum]|nr:hypothetical protein Q3G72_033862 [Acer saccharum]
MVLKYIEDADLRQWSLPNTNAFRVGLKERCSKLNCITNPYMYEQQLLEMSSIDLISKGNSYVSARQSATRFPLTIFLFTSEYHGIRVVFCNT